MAQNAFLGNFVCAVTQTLHSGQYAAIAKNPVDAVIMQRAVQASANRSTILAPIVLGDKVITTETILSRIKDLQDQIVSMQNKVTAVESKTEKIDKQVVGMMSSLPSFTYNDATSATSLAAGSMVARRDTDGDCSFRNVTLIGHIQCSSDVPTITAGSGAGFGAICSLTGTNSSGQITIKTGTQLDGGVVCTVFFSNPSSFTAAPIVLLNAKGINTLTRAFPMDSITDFTPASASAPASVSFSIVPLGSTGSHLLCSNTIYQWTYVMMENRAQAHYPAPGAAAAIRPQ